MLKETKHQTSTLSTTFGMGLLRHLLPVLLISQVIAQSCVNYGNVNGTSCECPPGVGAVILHAAATSSKVALGRPFKQPLGHRMEILPLANAKAAGVGLAAMVRAP